MPSWAQSHPERACDIIVACVVLHNIAIFRGERCPSLPEKDPDHHPDLPADTRDGRAVRDAICYNLSDPSPPM